MAASIITIADAVVVELNEPDNAWSLPFTASRVYVPVRDLKDMAESREIVVGVVPKSLKPRLLNRAGANMYDYFIDIGIQRVIGVGPMSDADINAAADPLMSLAEEVVSAFFLEDLPIVGWNVTPKCIDAENTPIYHPPDIDEKKLFTTVVTLNYRLGR